MPEKSYKVDGEVYDNIPEEHADAFLKQNPKAVEIQSFTLEKDTFDIPIAHVDAFTQKNPGALPLKKKDSIAPTETVGEQGQLPEGDKALPKPPRITAQGDRLGQATPIVSGAVQPFTSTELTEERESQQSLAVKKFEESYGRYKDKAVTYAIDNKIKADEQGYSNDKEYRNSLKKGQAQEFIEDRQIFEIVNNNSLINQWRSEKEAGNLSPEAAKRYLLPLEAKTKLLYDKLYGNIDAKIRKLQEELSTGSAEIALPLLHSGVRAPGEVPETRPYTEIERSAMSEKIKELQELKKGVFPEDHQKAVDKAFAEEEDNIIDTVRTIRDVLPENVSKAELLDIYFNVLNSSYEELGQKIGINKRGTIEKMARDIGMAAIPMLDQVLLSDDEKDYYMIGQKLRSLAPVVMLNVHPMVMDKEGLGDIAMKSFMKVFPSQVELSATEKEHAENIKGVLDELQIGPSKSYQKLLEAKTEQGFWEGTVELGAGLLGITPKLMISGGLVGAASKGMGIIQYQQALSKSKKFIDRAGAFMIRGVEEEAKFALAFPEPSPGAGVGFKAGIEGAEKLSSLYSSKYGKIIAPWLQKVMGASVGTTAGMEASETATALISTMDKDVDFKDAMVQMGYIDEEGNWTLDKKAKHTMQMLIVNGVLGFTAIGNKAEFKKDLVELSESVEKLGKPEDAAQFKEMSERLDEVLKANHESIDATRDQLKKEGIKIDTPKFEEEPLPVPDIKIEEKEAPAEPAKPEEAPVEAPKAEEPAKEVKPEVVEKISDEDFPDITVEQASNPDFKLVSVGGEFFGSFKAKTDKDAIKQAKISLVENIRFLGGRDMTIHSGEELEVFRENAIQMSKIPGMDKIAQPQLKLIESEITSREGDLKEVKLVEEKVKPTKEQERTTNINKILDLQQAFNKLTTAERTKDTASREAIIKLASELELKVEGTDKIDIKTDGQSLGRPREELAEEHVALKDRPEKTQKFIQDVTELGKLGTETIMGIGMNKKAIEQAIKNIEEGKDTKAAREFVDIMDNFVEQGYVEIRAGQGIDARWVRMELNEFTGKAEAKEELRPEDVSDEAIESNEDLNELISAVGNEDGTINYQKLSKEIKERPELIDPLTEGKNETQIEELKARIHEQGKEQGEGVEPTPEAVKERKRRIEDLERQAIDAKTTEEFQAVMDVAEKLEAEPIVEPKPKEKKAPEKPEEVKEPQIAEDLRKAAEAVRKAKVTKPGQFKASTGFDVVWDGGLEVIAKSLEAGADIVVALDKGLKHIQASDWYKGLTKQRQTEFDGVFQEKMEEHMPKEKRRPEDVEPTVDGEIPVVDPMPAVGGKVPVKSKAEKVEDLYEEQRNEFEKKRNLTFEKIRKKATTLIFDVSGNVKRELLKKGGEEVVAEKDLIAGASAESKMDYEDASKKIFKGLSMRQESTLAGMIQSKRTIELDALRDKKGEERLKHPRGYGEDYHNEYLENLKENNPEGYKELEGRADEYFKAMRAQLDKLHKEGLLTTEAYELLKEAQYYSPRQFIQHLDPAQSSIVEGKTISVPDSGIKSLKEGSEESLMHDPRKLLNQVISRTNARIAKNKANVALSKFAEENPDNGFVTVQKPIGVTESGAPKYSSTPAGKTLLKAQIKGETVRMLMDNEFAEEWIRKDPLINADMANVLSVASGASALRFMATGANPAFALTNVPRDVAHVLLLTDVYSPMLPLGLAQISKDIANVTKDAITRKGRYRDYIKEGGGMEFLTQQGRILRGDAIPTSKVKQATDAAAHVLGYFNETSEVMVRLAIRERSIDNQQKEFKDQYDRKPTTEEQTAIQRKATWIARNQMDFSQGGSAAKAIDSVIPYTNASIQGTRVLFRYATSNPKTFAAKVTQLGAAATGLYLYNSMQEGWDDVSDVNKSMNFIIMTPFYTTDEDGNKEYRYITIPKSHEQIPIAGMFEGLAEWTQTGKLPYKKTVRDLKLGLPSIPFITSDVPILNAIRTYESNWDNFREDKIWKGNKVEDWAEFNKYTPEFWKDAGKLLDMSPERMKRATEKITTNLQNNFYTNLGGMAWNMVTDGLSKDQKDDVNNTVTKQMEEAIHPLMRRYIKSTNPKQKEGELERYSIEENTKRKLQNDDVKEFVNKFHKGDFTRKDFKVELEAYDKADRKRLMDLFVNGTRKKGIDFWYTELKYAPSPEVKARAYFDKWKDASEEERKEMKKNAKKMGGIFSRRFNATFKTLQKPYVNK